MIPKRIVAHPLHELMNNIM